MKSLTKASSPIAVPRTSIPLLTYLRFSGKISESRFESRRRLFVTRQVEHFGCPAGWTFKPDANPQKNKIDQIAKFFCLNNGASQMQYGKTTRDRNHGGYGYPHFTKFTEALLLQQTFKYVQFRSEGIPLDIEMSFFHSNLGNFIGRICEFTPIRSIRSTWPPNYFYKRIKEFIQYYGISKDM